MRAGWIVLAGSLVLAYCAPLALAQSQPEEDGVIRLRLSGDDDELEDAINAASLVLALDREGQRDPQDLLSAAQADYRRILTALYSEGYYSGVIRILINGREAASIPSLSPPDRIDQIQINVEPGRTFRFGQTNVSPIAPGTIIPDTFRSGRTARTERIREAVTTSIDGWRALGYAKADISDQRITARHPDRRLDVRIAVAPGPRLRFGDTLVEGNRRVRTERIRAIAGIPEGEVFSPDERRQAQTRLRRAGAFRSTALIEAETPREPDLLDITAQVVEAKRRRLGVGIELSSDEGATLSSFWLHRNLLGGAERLRFDVELGGIGSESGLDFTVGGSFNRPATFNADTDFFANAKIEVLDEPEFESEQITIGVGLRRYIGDDIELEFGVGLQAADVEDDLGRRDYVLLTFPLAAQIDRRNDPLNATAGYYIDATATPYFAIEGSDDGGQLTFDGRYYISLSDSSVIALRGQLGAVFGSSLEDTPTDFLFFSGGGGTVRGHAFQELAVELDDGDRIGGRSFLGTSLELRQGITDTISLVGFFDAGYIGEESFPDGSGEWHSGAGLGVRYDTGIGPIRVDVGVPVSGESSSDFQLYLGIGQAF